MLMRRCLHTCRCTLQCSPCLLLVHAPLLNVEDRLTHHSTNFSTLTPRRRKRSTPTTRWLLLSLDPIPNRHCTAAKRSMGHSTRPRMPGPRVPRLRSRWTAVHLSSVWPRLRQRHTRTLSTTFRAQSRVRSHPSCPFDGHLRAVTNGSGTEGHHHSLTSLARLPPFPFIPPHKRKKTIPFASSCRQ